MVNPNIDREIRDSERYVLSSLIYHLSEIQEMIDVSSIDSGYFRSSEARDLWKALEQTLPSDGQYDTVLLISSIRNLFVNPKQAEACIKYLNELSPDIHYFSIEKYLEILKNSKIKRSLDRLARNILSKTGVSDDFVNDLDEWRRNFSNIFLETSDYGYVDAEKAISDFDDWLNNMDQHKASTFFKTGYQALDEKLKYLSGGQLIVLASRPGIGKTTFSINVIYKNFKNIMKTIKDNKENKRAIGMFSLEMTINSLLSKLIAIDSNVALSQMQRLCDGESVSHVDKQLMNASKQRIKDVNLLFCDEANVTLGKLTSIIRTWAKSHDLKLVIVDYLQLVNIPESKRYDGSNQYQKIGLISRTLKLLAMELNICIFALAQLNRKSEERRGLDKSPILSDLRESGSIEQDADVVMFLYEEKERSEEDAYETIPPEEQSEPDSKSPLITMLKIAKNRHGPTGKIKFSFEKDFGVYKSLV